MKLHKAAYLVFAIYFLATKLGVALNLHYCGENIARISYAAHKKGCGMEEKPLATLFCSADIQEKSCCKDEVQLIQNKDQNPLVHIVQLNAPVEATTPVARFCCPPQILSSGTVYTTYHHPPHAPPRYQLYCQYLFYA